MKVYTAMYAPFRCGGNNTDYVATEIEEYERVALPGGNAALVVKNPVKKLFHAFLEECGALVGTGKSKTNLIEEVKHDAETGDPDILNRQIEQGIKDCTSARLVSAQEFFSKFKEEN